MTHNINKCNGRAEFSVCCRKPCSISQESWRLNLQIKKKNKKYIKILGVISFRSERSESVPSEDGGSKTKALAVAQKYKFGSEKSTRRAPSENDHKLKF